MNANGIDEDDEERRTQRARQLAEHRRRIVSEFMQTVGQAGWESAAETLRWVGYVLVFIIVLCVITPHS